jgi:putative copper resistance protein D
MLALAAYNRFGAMPALHRGLASGGTRAIRISIGVELVFGILVLAAAAVLGITPPPE